MHPSTDESPDSIVEARLARRDWILLPTICILTAIVLAVSVDVISKRVYVESKPFTPACMRPSPTDSGYLAIPNFVCWDKNFESRPVEYRFNSCGHRAGMECGPKPRGAYRIVMTGSSVAMGHLVPREKTAAALLPGEISRITGRNVQLYNEGMITVGPSIVAKRMSDVLAANPDLILWIITPRDIEGELPDVAAKSRPRSGGFLAVAWFRIRDAFASRTFSDAIDDFRARALKNVDRTAPAALLLHLVYQSENAYLKSALASDASGFMQVQPNPAWQTRLRNFEIDAADVEKQAAAAGVPLVAVVIPSRAEAAMISKGDWPASYDPFKLDGEVGAIITRHGGNYVQISQGYRTLLHPENHYYPVDGHPDADGHATIATLLAKALTSGAVPALKAPDQPMFAAEAAR